MPFSCPDLAVSVYNPIWVSVQHLELPPYSCCIPSSLTPSGQVCWDMGERICDRKCVSQGLCLSLCHGTLPSCQGPGICKSSWTHLFKRLPLSSVVRPCCGHEKGHTNFLEASRDRRIRDTTTLNFLRISSSGASAPAELSGHKKVTLGLPTPQAYHRNPEILTDVSVSCSRSLASLLLKLIEFIKVHQRVKPELRWISWNFTKPFAFFSTERHAIKMPNTIPLELHFVFNLISFVYHYW